VEKSPVKRYSGPTISGTIALALGLLGLGLDLPDPVVLAVTTVLLVAAALWAAWIRLWPRVKAAVIGWLRRELVQPVVQASTRTAKGTVRQTLDQQGRAIANREAETKRAERATRLRLALNKVSEEIEYINGRVAANDKWYWDNHNLPADAWVQWGEVIAGEDDEAHAALRAVYRMVDTIQHSIDEDHARNYDVGVMESDAVEWHDVFVRAQQVVNRRLRHLREAQAA
jgi:hypothetical protein